MPLIIVTFAPQAKLVEEAYAVERKILEEAVVSKQPAPVSKDVS